MRRLFGGSPACGFLAIALTVASGVGLSAQQRNPDLEVAVSFVRLGDFDAAAEALRPLTQALEGLPRQIRELARAYLYLGVAELGRGRVDAAKEAFRQAQRRDRQLDLTGPEFSARVREVFAEAPNGGPAPVVEARAPEPPPVAEPTDPPPAPVDPGTWITRENELVTIGVALGLATDHCDGVIQLSRRERVLRWVPGQDQTCEPWQVAFGDVRAVVAAPRGGFSVQLKRQERGDRRVFMPAPEADVFRDGLDAVTLADITASARVAVRTAVATMEEVLGTAGERPPGPSSAGPAVFASIAELMETPGDFAGRPVRTTGRLDVVSRDKGQYVLYADQFSVMIRPQTTVAFRLKADAERLKDKEVEIVGTFSRISNPVRLNSRTPAYAISFWMFEQPDAAADPSGLPITTLEQLSTADRLPSGQIRVIGKFRSFNTLGDLPISTRRAKSDWVVKDDIYAAWVGGRPPSGDGWNLGALSGGAAFQWVEITGTAEEVQGAIYLRASTVRLSPPPSPGATVRTEPRSAFRQIVPDVQFTSPIEGLEDAASDTSFIIQFTKIMDPSTFAGRVALRYAGANPGSFSGMRVRYSDARRVLEVDPGVALIPGQTIELVLRSGITDSDMVPLRPEPNQPEGVVRLLRWKVSD